MITSHFCFRGFEFPAAAGGVGYRRLEKEVIVPGYILDEYPVMEII